MDDSEKSVVYYWSKEEEYPLENIEIFSDTLKSVNQSIEFYTNNAITNDVLKKLIEKERFAFENKFFNVSKTIINNVLIYRLEISENFEDGKENYLGTYIFSFDYGVILKGHPTISIVDSIVTYKNSKKKDVKNLTNLLQKIVKDTILFQKPPEPPTFNELDEEFKKPAAQFRLRCAKSPDFAQLIMTSKIPVWRWIIPSVINYTSKEN
jgi:hypothetical protein